MSSSEVIQTNGIIAVFAAGFMLNQEISSNEELQEGETQEMMERIFTIPICFFFGLFLPISRWVEMGWQLVLIALLILLFRKLPAFILIPPLSQSCMLKRLVE